MPFITRFMPLVARFLINEITFCAISSYSGTFCSLPVFISSRNLSSTIRIASTASCLYGVLSEILGFASSLSTFGIFCSSFIVAVPHYVS